MRLITLLLTILFIVPNIQTEKSSEEMHINDFKRTYFKIINKETNFYKINTNLPSTSQEVLATGYLDKDFNVDIIMKNLDQQSIEFFVFNDDKNGSFQSAGSFQLENPTENEKILTVHLIQLNSEKEENNGLVIISKQIDNNSTETSFKLTGYRMIYQDDKLNLEKLSGFNYSYKTSIQQPADPLNYNLFHPAENKDHFLSYNYWLIMEEKERKVISYNFKTKTIEKKKFEDLFDLTGDHSNNSVSELENSSDGVKGTDWIKTNYFVEGGTFQFIDLNHDCRPDIVLETNNSVDSSRNLEFYYYTGDVKPFKLIRRVELHDDISFATLTDLGQRNSLDLIVYNFSKRSLDVFMSNNSDPNKSSQDISTFCSGDNSNNFQFPFPDIGDTINLTVNGAYSYRILLHEPIFHNFKYHYGNNFKFVDLNMNGYPDLIFMAKSDNKEYGHPKIMKNVACTEEEAKEIYNDKDFYQRCRIFKTEPFKEYNNTLSNYNAQKFGMFDFGERGYFGMFLINYKITDNKITEITQTALLNFLDFENYNLKGKAKFSKNSWGTLKGLKMLIKKTSNTAEYNIISSTQSINQPNGDINIPNVIFGLGQITNYLEDFTIGFGVQNRNNPELKYFTPIIPNSRLIVYTPNEKSGWDLEILLNPNK